jgi:hypothetical protein
VRATNTGLAEAPVAVADHRDPLAPRLEAVADGAVADQTAPHGVGQVGSAGSTSIAPVASSTRRAATSRVSALGLDPGDEAVRPSADARHRPGRTGTP